MQQPPAPPLPNYFLADLPPDAELSPSIIRDSCLSLRDNRARFLAPRSTRQIIELLAHVADNWLQPIDPFRQRALAQAATRAGFSAPVLAEGLDAFWRSLCPEALRELVNQDLGHPDRLDRFVASESEFPARRRALATGPTLLVHLTAGNLPVPALMSIVLGLLVRSAQFVKCASGQSFIPRLFAHSIYAVEPKIGACLEIAEWPGGNRPLEDALFSHAQCLTATGTDETLAQLKARLEHPIRFLGYGHRVSFGYIAREVLGQSEARQLAAAAARDVAAWDQLGCLSPHLFYVESGGSVSPADFADALARELALIEERAPRASLPPNEAALIASRRAAYELRAVHSPETRLWQSPQSTAWTVVLETDPRFQLSCLHRFAYVKPVDNLDAALRAAATIEGMVSTVALAAAGERARDLAGTLARWGVPRVCPPGSMQNPPITWRHDGRPPLGDLVTWTDYES
jgi:hypothetical protein